MSVAADVTHIALERIALEGTPNNRLTRQDYVFLCSIIADKEHLLHYEYAVPSKPQITRTQNIPIYEMWLYISKVGKSQILKPLQNHLLIFCSTSG